MGFKKKTNTSQEIPTAALPDIIFMLLFFFMVTTVMKEGDVKVENRMPGATQLEKIEKRNLVSYLYIGVAKPQYRSEFGDEELIQANDAFIQPNDVISFVESEKVKLPEHEADQIMISLKVDKEAKSGIVMDVKMKLRQANALKIMYSAAGVAE